MTDLAFLENTNRLTVAGLERSIFLGFHPREKARAQKVVFTLSVYVRAGSFDDDVANTFDYDALAAELDKVLSQGHFALQESILEALARSLLAYPDVLAVELSSRKPEAYPDAQYAQCDLFRRKHV